MLLSTSQWRVTNQWRAPPELDSVLPLFLLNLSIFVLNRFSLFGTLHLRFLTRWSVCYALFSVLCILYYVFVLCTLYSVLCTQHHKLFTLYPVLCNLLSVLSTLILSSFCLPLCFVLNALICTLCYALNILHSVLWPQYPPHSILNMLLCTQ